MKKQNKHLILSALGVVAGGALIAGAGVITAKAETTITTDNFFVRTAAVRIEDERYSTGINFKVVMEKSVYDQTVAIATNVTTGVYIGQVSVVGGALTEATIGQASANLDTTGLWKEKTYDDTAYMETVAYIYDIPKAYFGSELTVLAYATVDGVTTYSRATSNVSLSWVADAAIAGLDETADAAKIQSLTDSYLKYDLKYYTAEGEQYGETKAVYWNEKVGVDAQVTAPEAPAGQEFVGWTNKAGDRTWDFENGIVKGPMNLYAAFETASYTVTLNADGGTLATTEFVYDDSTAETALPYPMKSGYAFEKWVDGEGNEVVSYGGGTTGDLTLTAVYKLGEGYTLNEYNEINGWTASASGNLTIADDVTKILGHIYGSSPTTTSTEFFIGKNSQLTYIGDWSMSYMAFKNSRFDMPKTVTYIGTHAFINCNLFIDFDEDLSALGYIGAAAFDGTAWYAQQLPNYSDNDVYLGNVYYMNRNSVAGVCTIKDGTVAIAGGAFMRATNVTGVEFPASLTTIGNNAFGDVWGTYASGITEITIPATVTTVNDSPFGSWTATQTIYVPFAEGAKPDGWSQHYQSDTKANFVYTQYALNYELNGGTNPTDAQNYYVRGEVYTLPVPEKTDFEFGGWYLADDFSGDPITAISATQVGAVTVYANWTALAPSQYTVTLNADGGTLATTEFVYDVNTAETALPYPMKAGYAFVKWVDGEGNEVVSYGGGTTGDKSLTAVYKLGEGYTLNEYNEINAWVASESGNVTIADDVTKILPGIYNASATTWETEFFIGKNSQLTYIGDWSMSYMPFKNSRFDMPKTVTYIGSYAFINCNFFIDFDEDLSALTGIGAFAMDGTAWAAQQLPNYSDNDVYIGNVYYLNRNSVAGVCTIKDGTVAIAGAAFMRATNVTGVEFPASLTTIGIFAFGDFTGTYASGITEITIPATVTTVGDSIFGSWQATQTVYLPFAEGARPAGWSQNFANDGAATFVYTTATQSVSVTDLEATPADPKKLYC